jgi:hypothetical protein
MQIPAIGGSRETPVVGAGIAGESVQRSGSPAHYAATSLYLGLTEAYNCGRYRTILSSGQACVVYRLAFASKDGDWILREDEESTRHVLGVMAGRGAKYRCGAPLDVRWMRGGWSSHLEYTEGCLRVRTDFVTRPPRITSDRLQAIWRECEEAGALALPIRDLIRIKETMRAKDYPIIGALAQRLQDPEDILRMSRSAHKLAEVIARDPARARICFQERPGLVEGIEHPDRLPLLLAYEQVERQAMDRARMVRYAAAIQPWAAKWKDLERRVVSMPLVEAHALLVDAATGVLPEQVEA